MKKWFFLLITITLVSNSAAQVQKGSDIDGEAGGDFSGSSISMPDANTIAIGAPYNSGNFHQAGHVRVYSWSGTSWVKKGKDIDGNGSSGHSVCMPNANIVAAGAYGANINKGEVRIHAWDGTNWAQKGASISGDWQRDLFGWSISMPDENNICIGATRPSTDQTRFGYSRVFRWNGSKWEQRGSDIMGKALSDHFGESVSMPDLNTIAIGAPYNNVNGQYSGLVRIYNWTGTDWLQKGQDIQGEDAQDRSGTSISMPDANTIAIGAPQSEGSNDFTPTAGHVRVYQWNGSSWTQKGSDIDGAESHIMSGWSVSMPDANTVAIGRKNMIGFDDREYVQIYRWNGTSWSQSGSTIKGEELGDFTGGCYVSMPDNKTVAIGAPYNNGNGGYSGHVRIFDLGSSADIAKSSLIKLSISPNPVTKYLTVKLELPQEKHLLSVYNINGKLLKNETYKNTQETTMDLSQFSSGVYLLKITDSENRVVTQKITKQ